MITKGSPINKLLVITEEATFVERLANALDNKVFLVSTSRAMAFDTIRTGEFFAALLDIRSDALFGRDLLRTVHREIEPYLPIIVLLDKADIETAVQMMRLGAYDCIAADRDIGEVRVRIRGAIEQHSLDVGSRALSRRLVHDPISMIVGSDVMRKVDYEVTRLAQFDFDVLLEGETGVGKDLIAHELHQRSRRKGKPFITIAVKSLSETLIESELFGHERGAFSGAERMKLGKLEAADGGTVYFPEISSLTDTIQLKLLHFLQYKTISRVGEDPTKPERKLDVRIIFASNEALEEQVATGHMRRDFYHRIMGLKISIPPLRERWDEIELLANYFLDQYSSSANVGRRLKLAEEVLSVFREYHWPGNVRELENCIKGAVAHCEGNVVTLKDCPNLSQRKFLQKTLGISVGEFDVIPDLRVAEEDFRRAYFREVLNRSKNNISKAAKTAGLTPQGFRKILVNLAMVRD